MGSKSSKQVTDPAQLNKKSTAREATLGRDLSGQNILITGGNSGIGYETTLALAAQNANVIFTARNFATGQAAEQKIIQETKNQNVKCLQLDLARLQSIQQFVEGLPKALAELTDHKENAADLGFDIFIANAGVYLFENITLEDTKLEMHFGVNHFGHFSLFQLILPLLEARKARTVIVASGSHRACKHWFLDDVKKNYQNTEFKSALAYGISKLCNVYMARQIQKLYSATGRLGDAFALHPGSMINTSIAREAWYGRLFMNIISPWTKSVSQGASTTVRCAVDPSLEGKGGRYFCDCQEKETTELAKQEEPAAELWQYSLDLFAQHFPNAQADIPADFQAS